MFPPLTIAAADGLVEVSPTTLNFISRSFSWQPLSRGTLSMGVISRFGVSLSWVLGRQERETADDRGGRRPCRGPLPALREKTTSIFCSPEIHIARESNTDLCNFKIPDIGSKLTFGEIDELILS